MKTRAVLLFSALALSVSTGCHQKPSTEFVSPDGKFKVKFPGEPEVKVESAAGIVLKMYLVESWGRSYMVGWADVPLPSWESESRTKSRLFDGRDGALKAVNGKSNGTSKTIQLLDRFPGLEFGGTAEGKHLRARIYLVGTRMYQLLVADGTESFPTSAAADEFFNSFEVIDPPPAKTPAGRDSNSPAGTAGPEPAPPQPPPHDPGLIESVNGKFQARFPARPNKVTRTVGGVEFTGYAAEAADGSCTVLYAELPEPVGPGPKLARERVEDARDAAVKEAGGTLTGNKVTLLTGARRGEEFTATAEGKQLRGRVYLTPGQRLYQVTVRGTPEYVGSKAAETFLKSFELTK